MYKSQIGTGGWGYLSGRAGRGSIWVNNTSLNTIPFELSTLYISTRAMWYIKGQRRVMSNVFPKLLILLRSDQGAIMSCSGAGGNTGTVLNRCCVGDEHG